MKGFSRYTQSEPAPDVQIKADWGQGINTVLPILCLLLLSGCGVIRPDNTTKPIEAQKGGEATGGGGTLKQGNNTLDASTQDAETEIWYFPAMAPDGEPVPMPVVPAKPDVVSMPPAPMAPSPVAVGSGTPDGWTAVGDGRVAYYRNRVSSMLGSHQDLAGVFEAASKFIQKISPLLIFGVMATIGGSFSVAWSMGNERGYMVVSVMVLVLGIIWLIVPASNWWLILAIFPLGFWLLQQEGIVKLIRRTAGIP